MPRTDEAIRCEICIVGTGAAGGILAYELARRGLDVVSIEQGGPILDSYFTNQKNPEDFPHFGINARMPWPIPVYDSFYYDNPEASALYAAGDTSSVSKLSEPVFQNRQIFRVNGKQNTWGGVSLRFSERDFLGRHYGDSDVDWPISYQDLAPHYEAVERLITVCGNRDGLPQLPDGVFVPPKPMRPADRLIIDAVSKIREYPIKAIANRKAIETRPDRAHSCRSCGMCVYGCAAGSVYKFSSRLLPEIKELPNYRIVYDSKVFKLLRDPGTNEIREMLCLDTATRTTYSVRARTYVLAAGALETPRILFNSRDDDFKQGLANRSNLVGAYLQENLKVSVATSFLKLLGKPAEYDFGYADHVLIPRFIEDNKDFRGGYQGQFIHTILKRPHHLMELGFLPAWLRESIARRLFFTFGGLMFLGQPEAVKTNRVTGSQENDVFGVPKIDIDHRWTDNDRKMQQHMKKMGRLILREASGSILDSKIDDIAGNAIHYAGTCRMASSPAEGVVDADLRSFDHPNLYIGDASVFPTLSEKNLTLTIMALAHRLADHLGSKVQGAIRPTK